MGVRACECVTVCIFNVLFEYIKKVLSLWQYCRVSSFGTREDSANRRYVGNIILFFPIRPVKQKDKKIVHQRNAGVKIVINTTLFIFDKFNSIQFNSTVSPAIISMRVKITNASWFQYDESVSP